jgi:hypothetical protein
MFTQHLPVDGLLLLLGGSRREGLLWRWPPGGPSGL